MISHDHICQIVGISDSLVHLFHNTQAECRYPQSTDKSWMGDRPEWPFPVVAGDFGAQL